MTGAHLHWLGGAPFNRQGTVGHHGNSFCADAQKQSTRMNLGRSNRSWSPC
jgi:hypothetical protein